MNVNYQKNFKRYELKYLITKDEQRLIKAVMNDYMKPDEFGKSTIINMYLDTPTKLLIRRSIEKPVYKEKLRIRSYGIPNKNSTVFMELKKKYKGVVYKRRINMSEEEAENYLYKNIIPSQQNQVIREINYFCDFYRKIEPSVILSYEREAFYSKVDSNFRVTFDENILWRNYDLSLTKGVYGKKLLQKDMVLLEIKTVFGIPFWMTNILSKNHIYKTSFSKYGNAYKSIILKDFLGGIDVA